jgi:hypothetical protein
MSQRVQRNPLQLFTRMASAGRDSWTFSVTIRNHIQHGGHWQGTLTNDGAKMQVRVKIESSDSATLQLDDKPAEKITEIHLEGVGFTGASNGVIESPDARRTGAKALSLKLIPHKGMLVGRILATDSKTVMLPYVLSLNRVPA